MPDDPAHRAITKPILVLDFDGVIHSYENGWGDGSIYGHATTGFWEWAIRAERVFRLCIHSSRIKTAHDATMVEQWLAREFGAWRNHVGRSVADFPYFELCITKPPAFLTIDDRALCFHGDWTAPFLDPEHLHGFRSWVMAKPPLPPPDKPQNDSVSRETSPLARDTAS